MKTVIFWIILGLVLTIGWGWAIYEHFQYGKSIGESLVKQKRIELKIKQSNQ